MNSRPSAGVERLTGLLQWWGMTGAAPEFERIVKVIGEAQQAYIVAAQRHMESVFAANDRIRNLARAAFDLQKPPEFLRAQMEIVEALTQTSAAYASTWTQLSTDIQRLCRELAMPSDGARPTAPPSSPSEPAPQSAERRPVHAAAA